MERAIEREFKRPDSTVEFWQDPDDTSHWPHKYDKIYINVEAFVNACKQSLLSCSYSSQCS
jgi:hypothetical protein